MNAARCLVLAAVMGLGVSQAPAQQGGGTQSTAPAPKPSAGWDQPGGARPPEIPGKRNAALMYYGAWDAFDMSLFERVQKNYDGKRVLPAEAAILKDSQKFVDAAMRAAETPECDWGPDYSAGPNALLPHLSYLRSTARFLGADARRCVQEHDINAAAKRVVAIVQMSQQLRGDRVLISALVGAALNQHARVMTKAMMDDKALTPEAAHVIMAALKGMPEDPFGFRACMTTERALGLEWVRDNYTGPDAGAQLSRTFLVEVGTPSAAVGEIEKLNGDELKAQLDRAALYYDELDKLWCQEGKEKEFAALERRLEKGEFGLVATAIAPAISKANATYLKSRTSVSDFIGELAAYIRDWQPPSAGQEGSAGK